MSLIPLAVIAYCVTAACVVEALQWLFVWRTPGFRVRGPAGLRLRVQPL